MSLLDAKTFDFRRQRRRQMIALIALVVLLVAAGGYIYWPRFTARRTVNDFMQSLIDKNYQKAYYLWQADPKAYPMDAFMQDWGPSSQWGIIKTYKIEQLGPPPGGNASGLVAIVQINGIPNKEARIWVENGSHIMSFYQF